MPIADAKRRKIGNELIDWVYLGVRTGMRRAVTEYRAQLAAGNTQAAIAALKRGVDIPRRARARVLAFISAYNTRFGSGGQAFLSGCVALVSTATLAEVNAELTTLETYAQGLVSHFQNDGWTYAQIANDIEANIELESDDWVFPIPAGPDIWGE